MAIDLHDSVEARLTAYIAPNKPRTEAQQQAFEQAVEAQVEYEKSGALAGVPSGVNSFSLGDFSVTLSIGAAAPEYTRETISPYAWALLHNAGLLRRGAIPTARRV